MQPKQKQQGWKQETDFTFLNPPCPHRCILFSLPLSSLGWNEEQLNNMPLLHNKCLPTFFSTHNFSCHLLPSCPHLLWAFSLPSCDWPCSSCHPPPRPQSQRTLHHRRSSYPWQGLQHNFMNTNVIKGNMQVRGLSYWTNVYQHPLHPRPRCHLGWRPLEWPASELQEHEAASAGFRTSAAWRVTEPMCLSCSGTV